MADSKKIQETVSLGRQGDIKFKKGGFTAKAKKRGLTPAEFQKQVLANPDQYDTKTVKQANLRKTLVGFDK